MTTTRTVAFTLGLVALSATPSTHARAQASPVIDDPEAYAVYAAVMPRRFDSGDKVLAIIALLEETRTGMDCDDHGRIQPEWRPVLESYRKENARVRLIQSGFNLGVPYSIVTLAQLRNLMQDAGYSKLSPQTNAPGSKVFARFPGGRLVALSAVGFNADRTRAIVTLQYDCFPSLEPATKSPPMCQEGRRMLMEKKNGRWVGPSTSGGGCFWIA